MSSCAERIVDRRREGKHIYYRLVDEHVEQIVRMALDHVADGIVIARIVDVLHPEQVWLFGLRIAISNERNVGRAWLRHATSRNRLSSMNQNRWSNGAR
jgi:hypothetical protein